MAEATATLLEARREKGTLPFSCEEKGSVPFSFIRRGVCETRIGIQHLEHLQRVGLP
ncbi:MAG: hypothetical protein HW392_347, partial [Steroidobacteraceae bacterium]|nr:hypothetical protein [Steroidobacteraceae bacterium]